MTTPPDSEHTLYSLLQPRGLPSGPSGFLLSRLPFGLHSVQIALPSYTPTCPQEVAEASLPPGRGADFPHCGLGQLAR